MANQVHAPILKSDRNSMHPPENLIQTIFSVTGMDCADEVGAIQSVLSKHKEIVEVHVNLMAGSVTIHHLPSISVVTLRTEIESAGVRVKEKSGEEDTGLQLRPKILVFSSGLFVAES